MIPKRVFWLVTGTAVGAGLTLWAERKVRRALEEAAARLQPDALVVEVGRSARQVAGSAGGRVREAMSSGREEMLRREEELWSELAASGSTVDAGPLAPPMLVEAVRPPATRPTASRVRRPRIKLVSHLDQ